MKKLTFALVCVLFTTVVFSQVKVRPGVKLGANFSNLTNVDYNKRKLGLDAGIFVNVHLTSFYELQVETSYSNQGTTYRIGNLYYSDDPYYVNRQDLDFDLEYVSLGIANKFFPAHNNGFNIIVGPSLDILVSENDYDTYMPIDFSLFGGVGYEFPYGLSVEIRYKQGLLDIRQDYYDEYNDGYYYNDDENYFRDAVLNGVIQLGVAYKF
ncbi:porin family protein [Mariniflexile gromovii]|uniref:PorT family protein n=1 Tax=Mariniflexile gromovii TaxID=362523 RepID=A0ABS4BYZ2_9FLAO|nr:porin family protein [Mariniflexile gromovii]MBP0905261.1 PorT family protein [Mariniflexile gromovii]